MKTVFVAMRSIQTKGGGVQTFPIGVFSDKADALKAADECPRAIEGVNGTPTGQALAYIGLEGVGGGVLEVPFVAGAGLVTPPETRLILPG